MRAHAETMVEMWLREEGLDAARTDPGLRGLLANKKLFRPISRVEADRHEAFTPWLDHGPDRLTTLLKETAPGSAGQLDDGWLTRPDGLNGVEVTGPVPELWYLGQGRIGNRPADGFPVAVPLLDESHLQISSTPDGRETAENLVQNLLLRVISYFRPGLVRLHVWDVGSFTGTLPGLYPLTRNGLLTVHDPTRLPQLLEELSDRIRRVHTQVLVDGHPSLRALAAGQQGHRPEPWLIAVLIGSRNALREDEHRQLQRVARGGLACGIQLVLLDVPVTVHAAVETVRIGDDGLARTSMTGVHVRVTPEPAREPRRVAATCHRIADEYDDYRSRIAVFGDLLPKGPWGTESSKRGLVAPVGFTEGVRDPVAIELKDLTPHALIGGPSGSGKTNLLLTMISSMAARYGPDEVAFYLLDFKEGVSFAQFAPGPPTVDLAAPGRADRRQHQHRPGVRAGPAAVPLRRDAPAGRGGQGRRGEQAGGAAGLGGGRARAEGTRLLAADRRRDRRVPVPVRRERRGDQGGGRPARGRGPARPLAGHPPGAGQPGHLRIQVFWGRPAVFEQFVLRIALPRARRVLVDTNEAAVGLPRWHAVINPESGTKHGNKIVRIPDASSKGLVEDVQKHLHRMYHRPGEGPKLFDGSRSPRVADLVGKLPAADDELPRAVLGQCIDVTGRAATVTLSATPGRNIGVLGSVGKDAVPTLTAAAVSLVGQLPTGGVRVVIAPLVVEATEKASWLEKEFLGAERGYQVETVPLDKLTGTIEELSADITRRLAGAVARTPVIVVLYAADAAETTLGRVGTEALRNLLRHGPETGVHVLGWWRSIQRLRALLTLGASVDDLGAWVALDVHGAELGPLVPGMLVSWAPRSARGLFFDRAQHAAPEVIIVPSLEAP